MIINTAIIIWKKKLKISNSCEYSKVHKVLTFVVLLSALKWSCVLVIFFFWFVKWLQIKKGLRSIYEWIMQLRRAFHQSISYINLLRQLIFYCLFCVILTHLNDSTFYMNGKRVREVFILNVSFLLLW